MHRDEVRVIVVRDRQLRLNHRFVLSILALGDRPARVRAVLGKMDGRVAREKVSAPPRLGLREGHLP